MASVIRFSLLLLLPLLLHAKVFELQPKMDNLDPLNYIQVYEDPMKKMTIETIGKAVFRPVKSFGEMIVISDSHWWVRLDVNNNTDKPITWDTEFIYNQMDVMNSWQYAGHQLISTAKKGDHNTFRHPQSLQDEKTFNYVTQPHQKQTIYFHVYYKNGGVVMLEQRIWTSQEHNEYSFYKMMILVAILSVSIMLLVYNLMIFFILKSKAYFWYITYLISAILIFLAYNQIGGRFVWNYSLFLIDFMPIFASSLMVITATLFTRSFLNTPFNLPKIDKLMIFFIGMNVIAMFLPLVGYRMLGLHLIQFNLFILIFFPIFSGWLWKRGLTIARGYTIAWVVLSLSIVIIPLRVLGFIPNSEFSFWIVRSGFIFEGMLLSIALADRITILQNQYKEAQDKIKQTLQEAKDTLEAKVRLRTSELEEAKQIAEQLAQKDELTALLNRRAFFEQGDYQVHYANRYETPLCLIMMDIDHFKQINDTYGHHIGDVVLKEIANTLAAKVRNTDVVARIGGEEFVILLPNTNSDEAMLIAEELRKSIECLEIIKNTSMIKVTSSFGIALFNKQIDDLNSLLEKADRVMYNAKESGRNRCTFLI